MQSRLLGTCMRSKAPADAKHHAEVKEAHQLATHNRGVLTAEQSQRADLQCRALRHTHGWSRAASPAPTRSRTQELLLVACAAPALTVRTFSWRLSISDSLGSACRLPLLLAITGGSSAKRPLLQMWGAHASACKDRICWHSNSQPDTGAHSPVHLIGHFSVHLRCT